jgi:FkbM family methyltransferase
MAALHQPFVQPGDLCFDVGAHVGDRARVWRGLGARVVAVEPQPTFARWLRWLYRGDGQVKIVEAAVGAAPGRAPLLLSDRTPTVSSLSPAWVEGVRTAPRFAGVTWERTVEVEVVTLDSLIARFGRPALCKLDVEGNELPALRGLSEPIPLVIFEVLPAQRQAARACLLRLEALAPYEYNWTEREDSRFRSVAWTTAGAMAERIDGMPDGGHSGDVYARRWNKNGG